jgi:hypothetical protein
MSSGEGAESRSSGGRQRRSLLEGLIRFCLENKLVVLASSAGES